MLTGELHVRTSRRMEMLDLTDQVKQCVVASGVDEGVVFLFNPHTTAGLVVNEGADPDVQRDILGALAQILPAGYPYRHSEGNSPAHVLTALTGSSLTLFCRQGRLQLGTWQHIFFCEFDGPRSRKLWWKILAG